MYVAKKNVRMTLLVLTAIAALSVISVRLEAADPVKAFRGKALNPSLNPRLVEYRDLAVRLTAISSTPYRPPYRITITGMVQNVGTATFSSVAPAWIKVYEDGRPVASKKIHFLRSGQQIRISYTRNLQPVLGTPPVYRLVVEPPRAFRTDGDPRNDDANPRNNQVDWSARNRAEHIVRRAVKQ